MRILSSLVRSFLNINTIWGLMILTAFLLCVVQHYLPTTTTLSTSYFEEGKNTVTIRIALPDDKVRDSQFTLTRRSGVLAIEPDDCVPRQNEPWLVSTEALGEAFLLKWDCREHGRYEMAVGDRIVADGMLVTLQSLTDAAFDYAQIGFEIALGLIAAMVLFLGLMKIGEDAGIVQLVARLFYPIMRFLYPGVPKDHPANGAILMNMTTTLLGLGNAATPFGLKAMKELQSLNPHKGIATDAQIMLLGYNTAGLALLPTTLIALRKSAGCADPFEIIGTCMFAGLVATVTAIVMVKVLGRLPFFSLKAAVAEYDREQQSASAAEAADGPVQEEK